MVFGEDENPNRYTFYKWIDLDRKEKGLTDQETDSNSSDVVYRVASVTFSEFGEEYIYICEDESIREDHFVVVPVWNQQRRKGCSCCEDISGFAKRPLISN